jgi:magnesium chelatase family protein
MGVATAMTVALHGAVGHLIDVQVDVSRGMVGTSIVGRPDVTLTEARDRCRMAVNNSGVRIPGKGEEQRTAEWPTTRRVTILLSPADLPKSGTHFDLAIAVATMAATGVVPPGSLADTLFVGELTLAGGLRSVPGVLPMVMAASDRGIRRVFVPEPQTREATMVPGMAVFGVRSLAQVLCELRGEEVPDAPPVAPMSGSRLLAWRGQERLAEHDLADLLGMDDGRFALEVAAAGGHHLMLSGPRGAGKTTLAERIPGILPDLTLEESLELTAIHSLAGALEPDDSVIRRPPFFAPHHDASLASLIGGGTARVRPGEISRAHNGVLFLDEFPLFRADVIEALRQPLESGEVTIARGEESATFPARGIVVVAANPCPCGDYDLDAGRDRCSCTAPRRAAYRARFTGPIADRIDILRHVRPVTAEDTKDPLAPSVETSATVRARVTRARQRQHERYAGRSWRLNGHAPGPTLREEWPLTPRAEALLDQQLFGGGLTRRGATRVHRLAWTVTDLWGTECPDVEELDVALRLRQGKPLMAANLRQAAV